MSEYTNYLIYQTTANTVAELRAEVAQKVGPAVVVLTSDGGPYSEAEATTHLARTPSPRWVGLLSGTDVTDQSVTGLGHVLVLEDFQSWQLQMQCPGGLEQLRFGGDDDYAKGWFEFNSGDTWMTDTLAPARMARLSTCFGLPETALKPVLAYGRVWDFLEALGAPSIQMLDQTLDYSGMDLTTGPAAVLFPWEANFD